VSEHRDDDDDEEERSLLRPAARWLLRRLALARLVRD
jgi:hypothetical protein